MSSYSLSHLSDRDLARELVSLVAQERAHTAALLAHIAEYDARRLYVPAGFPSMYLYCVHELHLSEEAARKRITPPGQRVSSRPSSAPSPRAACT